MSAVGELEARTQRRVIGYFRDQLGYRYLGNWHERPHNRNIEEDLLKQFLTRREHEPAIIAKALEKLDKAAALGGSKTLYDANREVYGLLRYGAKVSPGLGEHTVTVDLIDWEKAAANDFAIAEEVTVEGHHTKRPDIVLYVNGIALGILELKRSTVSVAQGIRQNLDNQKKDFIRAFFTMVQLVMAGNETEGLRYGVIETPERYWLRWKEADAPDTDAPLQAELGYLCTPARLLELLHDFVVFDAGVRKICRHNQYFGVKSARAFVQRREGGIIWHTQGSGKSLTMVWLAKWIRELKGVDGRVLIVTDRTETFGPYIHTYKYDEAVDDKVVLDLRYEARDIDQAITSEAKIDQWFDHKTKGLSEPGPSAAQAEVGHHAQGHELVRPDSEDRGGHADGHGDEGPPAERPRQRHARVRQRLRRLPVLRGVQWDRPEGQVRHRHFLRSGVKRHQGRRDGRGPDREAADRRRQAADRLRRTARDLSLYRQENAGSRSLPGDLPRQPVGPQRQGVRLHHRLQGPVPVAGGRDQGLHGRSVRGL